MFLGGNNFLGGAGSWKMLNLMAFFCLVVEILFLEMENLLFEMDFLSL